jgi:hypothetical protein
VSEVNVPGPSCGYIDILDYRTDEAQKKEMAEYSKYMPLRPSSAGKCSRELAHELMEYRGFVKYEGKEIKTPETVRLLSLGHSVEYSLLQQFDKIEDFKVKYKQQVLSFFALPATFEIIEGSIDGCFISEKYKCLFDVKSKKEKHSNYFSSDWEDFNDKMSNMDGVSVLGPSSFYVVDIASWLRTINDPFLANNFYQLNMYFYDSGLFLQSRGIDHAAIIQYSKNTSKLREIRFTPSKELYEQVKNKYVAVSNAVDFHKDPTLVPKDFQLGSIKCAFCAYKKECYGDKDALKEYFKTWPKKKWPDDSSKVDGLDELYLQYKEHKEVLAPLEQIEADLIKALEDNKIQKVKFSDGRIYELKMLQSPRPHLELRRSKL